MSLLGAKQSRTDNTFAKYPKNLLETCQLKYWEIFSWKNNRIPCEAWNTHAKKTAGKKNSLVLTDVVTDVQDRQRDKEEAMKAEGQEVSVAMEEIEKAVTM